jgi:hypothetical protein
LLTEIVLYSTGIDTDNSIQIDGLKKEHNGFIRDAEQQYFGNTLRATAWLLEY